MQAGVKKEAAKPTCTCPSCGHVDSLSNFRQINHGRLSTNVEFICSQCGAILDIKHKYLVLALLIACCILYPFVISYFGFWSGVLVLVIALPVMMFNKTIKQCKFVEKQKKN